MLYNVSLLNKVFENNINIDRLVFNNKPFNHVKNSEYFNVHVYNTENVLLNSITLKLSEILFILNSLDLKLSDDIILSNITLKNIILKNKVIYL